MKAHVWVMRAKTRCSTSRPNDLTRYSRAAGVLTDVKDVRRGNSLCWTSAVQPREGSGQLEAAFSKDVLTNPVIETRFEIR